MAALVLASTSGSNVCAMNEAVQEASLSELMPVKKTTKKTSKKTSKKKTTTSSSSTGSSIISGILNNVIGSATFSQADLCAHTWKYSKPGCAFTSENLLAKAGGEIAANKVEEKLGEYYSKFGFSGSNTYFTFKTDGTFAAKIDGKSWQGNYTFDEKTHAIQMKGLILSMSGYATKTTNGISLLFDQKKLLNLIKTIGSLKGNSTLSALGTIANNYDGLRVGFEMTK